MGRREAPGKREGVAGRGKHTRAGRQRGKVSVILTHRTGQRGGGDWSEGSWRICWFCLRRRAGCSPPLLPLPSTLIAPCIRRQEEGGNSDDSNVEAARNYVQTCIEIGPPMIKFDTMSKRMKFLYLEEGHREIFEKK
eukprot:3809267-Pyramimonas_sp.AAC.2